MNGYNQYQNNQIATASREQILLMLYDGAIRFCKQAKLAISNDAMADKGKYIGKAMAIISEFSNSLDHQVGGEIAANLDALYNYMLKELSDGNVNNNPDRIDTVCTMLCELRATWAEAIEINNYDNKEPSQEPQQLQVSSV
ncbi:MAG: flagellar export chaperone FliS [Thermodesulfobacteriota bacterium]